MTELMHSDSRGNEVLRERAAREAPCNRCGHSTIWAYQRKSPMDCVGEPIGMYCSLRCASRGAVAIAAA